MLSDPWDELNIKFGIHGSNFEPQDFSCFFEDFIVELSTMRCLMLFEDPWVEISTMRCPCCVRNSRLA